ncbi:MAG: serine hydrolase [Planctomycetia bacterium]|nr:serine hydrolase [Planctomycetia bacterium]
MSGLIMEINRFRTSACFVAIVFSVLCLNAAEEWPQAAWSTVEPQEVGLDKVQLEKARDYALTGGGSGYITRGGKLVMSWGDLKRRYDLKSTTKSFGATALGIAILDGKIALTDKVKQHHPGFGTPPASNAETGWIDRITILHLASQTAGFEKPGGYEKLIFEPGTKWAYSDGGPNWLAECVTLAYKQDVDKLMFDRVFTPLGIQRTDLVWRNNSYRDKNIDGIPRREFGSGISANVDAMARFGLLYLRGGMWNGKGILPADFVKQAGTTVPAVVGLPEVDPKNYGNASDHYGLLWWNNADGTLKDVPRDAYWTWGLYDSLVVVIPSLDIVVARAGQSWKRDWAGHYDVLQPFLDPIVAAAKNEQVGRVFNRSIPSTNAMPTPLVFVTAPPQQDDLLERKSTKKKTTNSTATKTPPPYPPSPLIASIDWAPSASIVRKARGGDNWPLTWGDDDDLYTAYGDGKGFEPLIDVKLSMGLSRISGPADKFTAINLRSESFETRGDGARGKKASGLLMVDGTLYLWARNAANSQLAWSSDHGDTWTWSDWKMTESFGCPTFLNFGRNYAGARDEFVYIYSHDNDSAYKPADGMVLARVHKDRIRQREAYEFFTGVDAIGNPTWSPDVARRGAVFAHPNRCYRSGISYNAALQRYLWCQIIPGSDTRFEGGFAIYDALEPWGPWTTTFFTETWDVGPGETSSIPTKWISTDGQTIHLVFSGDDHFSVRRATLNLKHPPSP